MAKLSKGWKETIIRVVLYVVMTIITISVIQYLTNS